MNTRTPQTVLSTSILVLGLLVAPVGLQARQQPVPDGEPAAPSDEAEVLATINGEQVMLEDVAQRLASLHGGAQEGNVSLVELSEILGIAERTVRELTMKGALKREDVGVYNLKESIQGYLTYKLGNSEESKKEILLRKKADRELRELAPTIWRNPPGKLFFLTF